MTLEVSARLQQKETSDDPAEVAIRIPSRPSNEIVWARLKGFPWWPARIHHPMDDKFGKGLEQRNEALVVFLGEGVKYHVPNTHIKVFTGRSDDDNMPKTSKAAISKAMRRVSAVALRVFLVCWGTVRLWVTRCMTVPGNQARTRNHGCRRGQAKCCSGVKSLGYYRRCRKGLREEGEEGDWN